MRGWLTALLATALLAVGPAAARDDDGAGEVARIAGPLPRFFPHLDSYLDLPADARSHFRLAYVVRSQTGIPPDEIRMWYDHGGQTRDFELDPLGRITRLPDADALDAEPDVWINQPPSGGFSLSMQFEYGGSPARTYRRSELATGLEQANRAIRQAAGVASLFAPNMKTVVFVFDGAAPEAWGHRCRWRAETADRSGKPRPVPARRPGEPAHRTPGIRPGTGPGAV